VIPKLFSVVVKQNVSVHVFMVLKERSVCNVPDLLLLFFENCILDKKSDKNKAVEYIFLAMVVIENFIHKRSATYLQCLTTLTSGEL